MTSDMNFWVEVNAVPKADNSADLQIYIVKEGKDISFFQSDWRPTPIDSDIELIGTISRDASFNHTHTINSSHHLITVTPNSDGTVGTNNLDISDDFWIVLYNTSPNISRGWDLRYHDVSLCNNQNSWYRGNQTGWTITAQSGCPDVHIHLVRRNVSNMDGVLTVVSTGSTSASQSFYYGPLPNLPPNSTRFINPNGGSYSGDINVYWDAANDVNIGDTLIYTTYLVNSVGDTQTISSNIGDTGFVFDSTSVEDGTYGLKGKVCDQENSCAYYYTDDNFIINNTSEEIFTLTSIQLNSNNTTSTTAVTGNTVSLLYTSSGSISDLNVSFYSAGYPVVNPITTTNITGNIWSSSFVVDVGDTEGEISFTINSPLLDQIFYETTDSSFVVIDNPNSTSTSLPFNSYSSSICTDTEPLNNPDLFQIDAFSTEAKLFYSPVQGQNTSYYLAYGHESNNPIYGAVINQGVSTGVLSFDVNHLKPNTIYYFKIRGQNGCMPGGWSNELKIKTTSNSNQKKSFYEYSKITFPTSIQKIKNIFVSPDSQSVSQSTITPTVIPSSTTKNENPNQKKTTEKTKHCFLWWCW